MGKYSEPLLTFGAEARVYFFSKSFSGFAHHIFAIGRKRMWSRKGVKEARLEYAMLAYKQVTAHARDRFVVVPPPPCISYANVRNYYGPYAHCSLDKGVACAQHIQLPTHTCTRAWYACTLNSARISKCMQTQRSLANMKILVSHPCWHKQ